MTTDPQSRQSLIKAAVDYGPLIAFGGTFAAVNIFKFAPKSDALIWASGALAATSVIAVIAGLLLEKRVAWIPLIAAVLGIPFAVMTVVFKDPIFVKIKMTVVDVLIGGGLLIALYFGKLPLKALLGSALPLKDEAWPKLTLYYALFYLVMALGNEIIWRTQSDDIWVTWKMVSAFGGPIALTLCLLPFIMKNMVPETTEESETPPSEQ